MSTNMSDQGFHEIQLSGKQLVFLFMSAVVLAVVIFLLGVAVGRGVRGAVGDVPVSADAGTGESVPTDSAVPNPAEAELDYHDLLVGAETDPAAASPPTATPQTPPAPVTEPIPTPPSTSGSWLLQTGAYSTRAVADGQVAKLKQLDVPAFVLVPGPGSPDQLFRVRVGPYADRAEADQVRRRLERQGYKPSITR